MEGFASIFQTGAFLRSDSGSETWLTFGFQLIPKESAGSVWIGTVLSGQTLETLLKDMLFSTDTVATKLGMNNCII